MQKPNIAIRMLSHLGLGAMFLKAAPPAEVVVPEPLRQRKAQRPGRAVRVHQERKYDFGTMISRPGAHRPKHISVARKIYTGTLTVPGGRRGLQVRRQAGKGRKSIYRITG